MQTPSTTRQKYTLACRLARQHRPPTAALLPVWTAACASYPNTYPYYRWLSHERAMRWIRGGR